MKKTLCFLFGAALIGFCTQSNVAEATDFAQVAAGDPVTMTIAVSGAPDFSFNPSTNVHMAGTSVATAFQIWAYHDSVLGKDSGQAYGMASDQNKLYFLDISGLTTAPTVTGTNSTAFATWTTI